MIRQGIWCDICGSQKQETNHWFVACEQEGELRVGGWNSCYLLCPDTKQLCGESCVHKLVGEFLANSMHLLTQYVADKADAQPGADSAIDISITADDESWSRLLTPPVAGLPRFEQHSSRVSEGLPRWHTCDERRTS